MVLALKLLYVRNRRLLSNEGWVKSYLLAVESRLMPKRTISSEVRQERAYKVKSHNYVTPGAGHVTEVFKVSVQWIKITCFML